MSEEQGIHWFDRLAVRLTRRDALKGAIGLAGAAVVGSAIRPQRAFADDPNACRTGCFWTAHQSYLASVGNCNSIAVTNGVSSFPGIFVLGIPGALASLTGNLGAWVGGSKCEDSALTQQKADYWDCTQPGCNNFDPTQPGGPCETCTAKCCADPTVISGYSCCALGCACGSDSGACHSGSSPC
jgi:hypothetical protein